MSEIPTGQKTVHVPMVSGGMDSTVAAAVAHEQADKIDFIAYLDTRTGLDENREYVEELADHFGTQLWTLRTHEQYEAMVEEQGFPGPSKHIIMYNRLKERQISKLATVTGDKELVTWTGLRKAESPARAKNTERVADQGRWTMVSPIADWTKEDCKEYIDGHDLPENDLWDTLGRSGDCFCGAYASPEEKLDLRAAGCEYQAEWIESLEECVTTGDEKEKWGWGALSESERRSVRAEKDDGQITLCSHCDFSPEE